MKNFNLTGNTAVWDALNVEATNNRKGRVERLSNIPEDKVLSVSLLDKYCPRNPSTAEISEGASGFVFRKGRKRDFLLRHNGVCVGWATFHCAERNYDVAVTATLSQVVTIKAKSAEEAEQKAVAALEEAINEHNLQLPTGIKPEKYTADAQLSAE